MWIFTKNAFLSIVADKNDPNSENLLIRARRAGDIENVFGDVEVFSVPGSDYAFRAWVNRDVVADVMFNEVQNIDYSNFKNAIKDNDYHDAALDVWFIMNDYQGRMKRKG
jgi:hypothetical protein